MVVNSQNGADAKTLDVYKGLLKLETADQAEGQWVRGFEGRPWLNLKIDILNES